MAGSLTIGARHLDLQREGAAGLGAWLAARGVGAGEAVAVGVRDEAEAAPLLLGLMARGVTTLPLHPDARPSEVWALLERARARLLLTDVPGAWGVEWIQVIQVRRQVSRLWDRWLGRAAPDDGLPGALRGLTDPPVETVDPDAPALLLGTSGTTGAARLVALTHRNLALQLDAIAAHLGLAGGRMVNPLPWSHYDGLVGGLLLAERAGAELHRGPAPGAPSELLDLVWRVRATHLVLTPTAIALLARAGPDLRQVLGQPWFSAVISTAAPLSEALWTSFQAAAGCRVVNVYGLTETGNLCFAGPDDATRVPGTVGRPIYGRLRVVDPAGDPVPDGVAGELQVAGPERSPGYLGEPPHPEWLSTGDEALWGADGLLRVIGRRKEMIVSAGYAVWPAEVSAALREHPAVEAAETAGVPDEALGERVVSAVVLGRPATPDELLEHCRARLSAYKVPREIRVVSELPAGPLGKVWRDALPLAEGDVEARVLALAAAAFLVDVSRLGPATTPARCPSWDSLAHLDLVQRLERSFGVRLTPAQIVGIRCLGDAIELVRR